MEGYCQTTGCLRAYILRYFGDNGALGVERTGSGAGTEGYGSCSNCTGSYEAEDVTEAARAAVRFVQACGGRFGKALVADALHGANTEKVRSCRLDGMPGYGSLSEMPVGNQGTCSASSWGAGTWRRARGSTRCSGWASAPSRCWRRTRPRRSPSR